MKKILALATLLLATVAGAEFGTNGVGGVYVNGVPSIDLTSSGITGTLPLDHLAFEATGHEIWVDNKRTDTYTADGSYLRPYLTLLAAINAVNADVLVHTAAGTGTAMNYLIHLGSGTYSDNLTITGPRYLRIEGAGAVISGTILINSGVGSYDRIEFVGGQSAFSEKGPALTLSGAITLHRHDDSLIYVGFKGCLVSGATATDTDGTWVLMYENCRVNGNITGTFSAAGHPQILMITHGWNEFATGTISGKLAFYDANGSDFYGTINTTPHYASKFKDCSFAGSITIAPTATPDSALVYLDGVSKKSFDARTPTLTGATESALEDGGVSGLTATRVPFAATATTLEDDDGMTYTKASNTLNLGYLSLSSADGLDEVVNGTFTGNADGWTLGSDWTYGSNAVSHTTGTATLTPSTPLTVAVGDRWKVCFTISGYSGTGTLTPSIGGVSGAARSADGTYCEWLGPTSTASLVFTPSATAFVGTLDNVSAMKDPSVLLQNLQVSSATAYASNRSPILRFESHGWDTDDAVDRTHRWAHYLSTTSATTVYGTLVWASSTDGAAWTDRLTLNHAGRLAGSSLAFSSSGEFATVAATSAIPSTTGAISWAPTVTNAATQTGIRSAPTFTASSGTPGLYKPIAIEPTYNITGSASGMTASDLFINRTETALGGTPGAQNLIDAQVGGVSKFSVSNTGAVTLPAASISSTGTLALGTAGAIEFEGATADGFETQIVAHDPTGDRTIQVPDYNGIMWVTGERFNRPHLIVESDWTAVALTDGATNYVIGSAMGPITYREEQNKTTRSWVETSAGLDIDGDNADNEGVEILLADGVGATLGDGWFTTGSRGLCFELTFTNVDISDTDQFVMGFRQTEAFDASNDYTAYTNWATVGVTANDGSVFAQGERAGATLSDDSGVNIADGATTTLRYCIGADRAVSAYLNGSAITLTNSGTAMTASINMAPFVSFMHVGNEDPGIVITRWAVWRP